jgi:TonB-linked SusC/RagA family outer membrane protein
MKVGEHMSFIYTKSNGIGVGDQYNNTLRTAFQTSPIVPIYSDNNIYDSPYNDTSKSDWYTGDGNPYGAMMTENNNLTTSNGFAADAYAAISPIKGLTVKTDFAVNFSNSSYRSYTEKYQFSLYDYNTSATSVSQNMSHNLSMTSTTTASYDFNIQKHEISALAGIESYRYQGEYVGGSSRYLKNVFDSWQYAYIDNTEATNADDFSTSGHPEDDVRRISYFGRLSWNYDETFMANATLRADGSSRFANGHRWGYFPSVSAGWVITNHSWMKSTKSWLTFLKLRASWGQVGNQNIDNFQFVSPVTMTYTNYVFGTGLGSDQNVWGAYPSRLANDNIKWETSEQTDIGFDAVLFKNLRFNADYYYKKTKDWLVEAPILGIAGTGAPYINGGDVKNTGCEFSVNWNDTFSNGFNYSISANVSYNKNKVGNIPTEDGIIHGRSNMLYDNSTEFYRAQNGYPIGYFWGYKTAGIFQSQADIDAWKAAGKGILQGNVKPGDVKYVDVDNSGTIGDPDKVNLGNGMPDWTFGFTISLNYKNFDFSAVANGMTGNKIVQSYRNQARSTQNYTTAILRRWTGEGTSNKYPRVTNSNVNWDFSDLYVHDGDFLRISNITLGYDFAPLCRFKYLTKARLYFQVQNAFTFTKYDGMDPEIGYGMDDWVSGVDLGYYPRPRTCMIGVNLTF